MTPNDVAQLISSCGFPIVACGFLAWFIKTALENLEKRTQENTDSLNKLVTLVETLLRKDVDEKR